VVSSSDEGAYQPNLHIIWSLLYRCPGTTGQCNFYSLWPEVSRYCTTALIALSAHNPCYVGRRPDAWIVSKRLVRSTCYSAWKLLVCIWIQRPSKVAGHLNISILFDFLVNRAETAKRIELILKYGLPSYRKPYVRNLELELRHSLFLSSHRRRCNVRAVRPLMKFIWYGARLRL